MTLLIWVKNRYYDANLIRKQPFFHCMPMNNLMVPEQKVKSKTAYLYRLTELLTSVNFGAILPFRRIGIWIHDHMLPTRNQSQQS
jgi:hypothetical protein